MSHKFWSKSFRSFILLKSFLYTIVWKEHEFLDSSQFLKYFHSWYIAQQFLRRQMYYHQLWSAPICKYRLQIGPLNMPAINWERKEHRSLSSQIFFDELDKNEIFWDRCKASTTALSSETEAVMKPWILPNRSKQMRSICRVPSEVKDHKF